MLAGSRAGCTGAGKGTLRDSTRFPRCLLLSTARLDEARCITAPSPESRGLFFFFSSLSGLAPTAFIHGKRIRYQIKPKLEGRVFSSRALVLSMQSGQSTVTRKKLSTAVARPPSRSLRLYTVPCVLSHAHAVGFSFV
ncbi:hypothetical protein NDU88_007203 [Pleurodeles waltl]|uniref:Uncharacterized protein n=1 Tax=Pleurodeles waltl TaxID=8319 RepID=A0AAV7NVA6_PLEWA|nr:hypothetical protein NDU88_007203 [Pleurodeles waltl]